MARRRPLPEQYRTSPFTRESARADGLPDSRLRAADIERFGHGLYRERTRPRPDWDDVALAAPVHGMDPASLAVLLEVTGGALSHQSAAHLHGIPLPPWLADESDIHVTGPGPELRSRRPGVTGHRRPLGRADVVALHGLPVTTPERTWLDLAALLRPGQQDHLVVAGDHLVKHPWVEGRLLEPRTTPDGLRQALVRVGRFKGVRLARSALPLVRVGADSPSETLVRLRLVEAGLPEPDLQVRATDLAADPYPADLAYRQWRIALQYDGAHHRSSEQQLIDARRDAWFRFHGWFVIVITVEDLHDDLRSVVRPVREHAARCPA